MSNTGRPLDWASQAHLDFFKSTPNLNAELKAEAVRLLPIAKQQEPRITTFWVTQDNMLVFLGRGVGPTTIIVEGQTFPLIED